MNWRAGKSVLLAAVLHLGFMSLSSVSYAQAWSGILDPSRATNWTSAGFTIPSYSVACSTQPTLQTGSGNASANTTAIQKALNSCDASHNVVNLPAGTYYVAGITFGTQGKQVLRGAGASATYLFISGQAGCGGLFSNVCMISVAPGSAQSASSLPPSGSQQCAWTGTNGSVGTYTQGATSLILNSCGGDIGPPVGKALILDQANDSGADTKGVFICDSYTSAVNCTQKNLAAVNADGRVIGGVDYSEQQVVTVTAVSGSGAGPYTVTVSPGVYFNNIRSSQTPGAWWNSFVQNEGLENLTVDYSLNTSSAFGLTMFNCIQCWVKNVRSMWARRDHVQVYQGFQDVIRDSYFYQSQSHGTESYGIEPQESSGVLVENNIFQQITSPFVFGQGSGWVIGYNFTIGNISTNYMQGSYPSHNAGSGMNLWEGNVFNELACDDTWGTSTLQTYYRNVINGWVSGLTEQTIPIISNAYCRGYNIIGNVLGQPGYHTNYQVSASSATAVAPTSGMPYASLAIYELGTSDNAGLGNCTTPPVCDPLTGSTMMRWGNYDVVNGGVRWDATESSPKAVPYINAQSTPSSHTLPGSLYLSSTPLWWRSMPFPPIGPDVSSGNLGICAGGSYSGAQATASGQCSGGSLSASSWAGHANVIPAQDCYLNVMNGPPDGSGGILSFDASGCYTSQSGSAPAAPTNLSAVVQ